MAKFKIYFAGGHAKATDVYLQERNANRLFSQLTEKNSVGKKWIEFKKINPETPSTLFVDSGAFTAHTKGKVVDVDDYIAYLNENAGNFDAIAQLDTIPGDFGKPKTFEQLNEAPKLSWENYLYMRERVIDKNNLLPIFHMGEDFKWLENMLEARFDDNKQIEYIGISPANDSTTKHKDLWMEKVFTMIQKSSNPYVKTHAFGMTVLKQLERHPFYSADSTSPLLTGAMGNIYGSTGLISLAQKDGGIQAYNNLPQKVKNEIIENAERYGFTVEDLVDKSGARILYNCSFVIDWSNTYEYRGIKNRQKTLFSLT